ncbi:DUF4144 domain-containing protein [Vibrio makurazakiensis]|uniref:DUF4144 domain-containing protein n=1 Tax=Vibrio makurazakiensis TaxID=2910250 RepID=UPI003D12765E
MIKWPSLVKLDGDDELIYVETEHDFHAECSDMILGDDDYLIDSDGVSYSLQLKSGANQPTLSSQTQNHSIESITQLIRAHEFQKAEMCLTKIHFPSISEAIRSLSFEQ